MGNISLLQKKVLFQLFFSEIFRVSLILRGFLFCLFFISVDPKPPDEVGGSTAAKDGDVIRESDLREHSILREGPESVSLPPEADGTVDIANALSGEPDLQNSAKAPDEREDKTDSSDFVPDSGVLVDMPSMGNQETDLVDDMEMDGFGRKGAEGLIAHVMESSEGPLDACEKIVPMVEESLFQTVGDPFVGASVASNEGE